MRWPVSRDADAAALPVVALLAAALPWVAHTQLRSLRAGAAPDVSPVVLSRLSRRWLLECGVLLLVALTAGVEVASGARRAAVDAPLLMHTVTLCAAALSLYAWAALGTRGDSPQRVPRHQAPETRRERGVYYHMRLRARLAPLRAWWVAFASVGAWRTARAAAAPGSPLRDAADQLVHLLLSSRSTCVTDLAARAVSLLSLHAAPVLLAVVCAYTLLRVRAADYTYRAGEDAAVDALPWPRGQPGEAPWQVAPPRISSDPLAAAVAAAPSPGARPATSPRRRRRSVSGARGGGGGAAPPPQLPAAAHGGGGSCGSFYTLPDSAALVAASAAPGGAPLAVPLPPVRAGGSVGSEAPPAVVIPPGALGGARLRVAVLTLGTRGDVQPFIELGRHLRACGHSVVISSTDDFEAAVAAAGLEFGRTGVPRMGQSPAWVASECATIADVVRASVGQFEPQYLRVGDGFVAAAAGADVILATGVTASFALNIAEACGFAVPVWVARMAPDLPVPTAACSPPGWPQPSAWGPVNVARWGRFWLELSRAVAAAGVTATEDAFRARLGLPPGSLPQRVEQLLHMPSLLAWSSHLLPTPQDYPRWALPCGFLLTGEDGGAVHATLARFVGGGADGSGHRLPLVVVTFGSMVHADDGLLAALVTELRQRRCRVLVLTGWKGEARHRPAHQQLQPPPAATVAAAAPPSGAGSSPSSARRRRRASEGAAATTATATSSSAPATGDGGDSGDDPHVLYWPEAPHGWLFGHAALIIHHGGAGTTGRALASGAPSLILPVLRWSDQSLWGWMVSRARVGRCLPIGAPAGAEALRALSAALDDVLVTGDAPPAGGGGDAASRQPAAPTAAATATVAAARSLGALVRGQPAAATAQAVLESCLCNRMLPPAEADEVHPLVLTAARARDAAVLTALTPEQRMCVRSCVPCARVRRSMAAAAAAAAAAPPLRL